MLSRNFVTSSACRQGKVKADRQTQTVMLWPYDSSHAGPVCRHGAVWCKNCFRISHLTTTTDGEAAGLRVIGMEEVWSAEAGMVLEGNAAALCIEYGRGDVAKAVQWVGPVLTCQHSNSLVFTQLHGVVNKQTFVTCTYTAKQWCGRVQCWSSMCTACDMHSRHAA